MILTPSSRQAGRATWAEFICFVIAYSDFLVGLWEARVRQEDPRDRPVPLPRFPDREAGRAVLLWMLYHDHVEHFRRVACPTGVGTSFESAETLCVSNESAFALNGEGEAFANAFLDAVLAPPTEAAVESAWGGLWLGRFLPRYDREKRQFLWGRRLLKHFRQPSPNQEIVLCAAEELGWPDWFDDPLPGRGKGNAKVRLHDTIKDLNRRQLACLIRFKGDGTGTRVGWEYR
jgi:hypothetical protein